MNGTLGIIEVVLVFALVLGLGVWQLRSVRRDTRAAAAKDAEAKRERPE